MSPRFVAIIRKELIEAWRTTKVYSAITLVYSLFLQWFIIRNYVSMVEDGSLGLDPAFAISTEQLLQMAAGLSLIYVAPMVMPFFANAILSRSFIEERTSQSLMPLLATGVKPGSVWLAKLISAFLFSYVVVLACLVIDVVMIKVYFGLSLALPTHVWVTAFLVTPVVCLGILALMSLLFWTVRQANVIAAVLPVVLSLGIWSYVSANPSTGVLLSMLGIALAGAAILIFGSIYAVNRLSRQFIVGL